MGEGAVDEDINRAESFCCRTDHLINSFFVGYVGAVGHGFPTVLRMA